MVGPEQNSFRVQIVKRHDLERDQAIKKPLDASGSLNQFLNTIATIENIIGVGIFPYNQGPMVGLYWSDPYGHLTPEEAQRMIDAEDSLSEQMREMAGLELSFVGFDARNLTFEKALEAQSTQRELTAHEKERLTEGEAPDGMSEAEAFSRLLEIILGIDKEGFAKPQYFKFE